MDALTFDEIYEQEMVKNLHHPSAKAAAHFTAAILSNQRHRLWYYSFERVEPQAIQLVRSVLKLRDNEDVPSSVEVWAKGEQITISVQGCRGNLRIEKNATTVVAIAQGVTIWDRETRISTNLALSEAANFWRWVKMPRLRIGFHGC